jgi:UDPglucose 6-dehydrogenase|tara:strand:+ start:30 stop:842 length:813 start_codon:yes stop_codon:yes gene_type:complete
MSIFKVGIVGAGFVGSSVINGFDTDTVEQYVVDPDLIPGSNIEALVEFDPQITFVCVPTPESDTGHVDVTIARHVLMQLSANAYKGIVVMKSTITPDSLINMKKDFGIRLVYNPEFLTEANAHQDFINPQMQVLGGKWKDCDIVEKAYVRHSKVKVVPTFKTDLISASLLKYTINSWLATKVSFFNELHELHESSGASSTWTQFTDMLTRDTRIGDTHMKVPGPDGKFGFGGHCFPKDTAGILKYAESKNHRLKLLETAVKLNEKQRSKD